MKNALVKSYASLAVAMFVGGGVLPAYAHADLVDTVPSQGEVITTPPEELRLTFTEGVELAFTEISITDADDDSEIGVGELSLDPEDNKTIIVPIEAELAAGTYAVEWAVVSADGHKIEGSYEMDIAP
jgi:copper resistance protein C